MAAFPPEDIGANLSTFLSGAFALAVGAVGTAFLRRYRGRRKVGVDLAADVKAHDVSLYGAEKTRSNPHPPPGLEERVTAAEGILADHSDKLDSILAKITPNGGDTREVGDMLVRLLDHFEIPIPEKGRDDPPA